MAVFRRKKAAEVYIGGIFAIVVLAGFCMFSAVQETRDLVEGQQTTALVSAEIRKEKALTDGGTHLFSCYYIKGYDKDANEIDLKISSDDYNELRYKDEADYNRLLQAHKNIGQHVVMKIT